MHWIVEFLSWIGKIAIHLISTFGYGGVFLLMAAESMILPVPAELVMPFAGFLVAQGNFKMESVFIASALGSLFGSLLSYAMGKMGGHRVILRFGKYLLLDLADLKRTENYFERHGEKTIFIGRFIPVVRHLISIPAGIGSMNLKKFSIYTIFGASIWNMTLAYGGYFLGKNWTAIRHYTEPVSIGVVILLLGGSVGFIYHHVKNKRENKFLKEKLLQEEREDGGGVFRV